MISGKTDGGVISIQKKTKNVETHPQRRALMTINTNAKNSAISATSVFGASITAADSIAKMAIVQVLENNLHYLLSSDTYEMTRTEIENKIRQDLHGHVEKHLLNKMDFFKEVIIEHLHKLEYSPIVKKLEYDANNKLTNVVVDLDIKEEKS